MEREELMVPPGRYDVKRISGLLPPWGVTKRIDFEGGRLEGCTYLLGLPVGRFRVEGHRFVYRRWPIVDVLDEVPQDHAQGVASSGGWVAKGRGRLFGIFTFCHFRLEPKDGALPDMPRKDDA